MVQEMEVSSSLQVETRILYLRHWNTIRTEEVTGNRVQDRYNFTLHDMTASTFPEIVRRIAEPGDGACFPFY
jgi:hypothetical protein